MKVIELKPIIESKKDYEKIEAVIRKTLFREIYVPILRELSLPENKIRNSLDELLDAMRRGKITYSKGAFRGKFNAAISKELVKMGAKWDAKTASYKLLKVNMKLEMLEAIRISELRFTEKLKTIDRKLAKLVPEEIASKINLTELFDKALFNVEKKIDATLKNITVAPQTTEAQREKISKEYNQNMELYIKNFTEEEILQIRATVEKTIMSGNRYESLIKGIKDSYGVTERKAKFLARQETHLLLGKYKEAKYTAVGSKSYIWTCVKMPHDTSPTQHIPGNVRYYHGILDGQVFRWDDPPITNKKPERRNNAGMDYNCLPGSHPVSFYGPVNKMFRRLYTGELVELITSNGKFTNTTANHPVLTQRGWIPAKDVQLGDYLFARKSESILAEKMDSQNMVSHAQNVFDAIALCVEVRSDTLSKSDFHTDVGSDEEVDIISIDRKLILHSVAEAYKELSHFIFEGSDPSTFSLCPLNSFLIRTSEFSSNLVGLLSEFRSILQTHFSHAVIVSFGPIPTLDARFDEPFSDNTTTDPIFLGKSEFTHPFLVIINDILIKWDSIRGGSTSSRDFCADSMEEYAKSFGANSESSSNFANGNIFHLVEPTRIIKKNISKFSSHVYNFETGFNWFFGDNIVMHNCRCYAKPLINFEELDDEE